MEDSPIRVGVIGAGGFGLFALQQFSQVSGVKLVGMAGTLREAAKTAARRFGIPDIQKVEDLVSRPDVDLVYIATPPFLHHAQAMVALRNQKHVICEKPLAMSVEQADEMIARARGEGLLLVANLMQRYNPLYEKVGELIRSKILGEPLHGYFENYASDEGLAPDHWFWDPAKSGGIFIEHGVHFFDMFDGWLGPGKVEAAQRMLRPGTNLEEQVLCCVRYASGPIVSFYHGFCQANRLDRQELRIVFERGDITLSGWVPTSARLRAVADEEGTRRLSGIFPGSRLDVIQAYPAKERSVTARHKNFDVYQMFEINYGQETSKLVRYGDLLREFLVDQLAWVRDRGRSRRVDEENGRRSLAMAVAAGRLARR